VLIQDIERKSQKLLSHYSDDKKKHDFLKKCVAKTIKHLKTASYLESIRKLIIGDPNLRDEKIEEKLRSHPGMRACYDEKKNPIVLIFNDEGIVCRGLEAKDYFSHISPVIYNPKARSELIERCLFRFGGEKNEVKKYLEKVFGKVISGYVDKDIIILYGPKGFNGKSALFKMLSITFGTELIRPGSEDILIERGKASVGAHKSYLMRTFGAILVYFSNPPKGRINCEDLKRLTDLEDVSAREIYGRQTEARPTAFFAIGLNKIDNIPPDDRAFHKRLRVISFPSEFIDKERKEALGFKGELPVGYYMIDPFFEKNFAEDENAKSSLLNLLIEGYYRYKNEGLTEPIAIKQAKNGLIIGNNPYLAFVSDCIVKTDEQGDEISASDLYNSYVAWCKVMMQEAVSASIFHRQISQCTDLPGSTKSNGKTFRRGYKYNDEMEKIKDEARMIHYDF
jgi:phage/plasmid-associated DNA primase